jgi:hypothetical protein
MSPAEDAVERAFWQALEDLKQGSEKPIEDYLRLVPGEQRQELAQLLAARGAAGILPGALKAMRNARGIEPDAVVARLAADFEVEGEEGRAALARNYHRLETGMLLGSKLSRRLLRSLASVFDVDPADIIAAAKPAAEGPSLKSVPAMGRSAGTQDSPRSRTSNERLPDPEVELVERLFHGGPDA